MSGCHRTSGELPSAFLQSNCMTGIFRDVCGMQGFRRGHSGLVALKAVNTALIMLYCQSEQSHYLCI